MTVRALRLPSREVPGATLLAGLLAAAALFCFVLGWLVTQPGGLRLAVAAVAVAALAGLGLWSPPAMLVGLFVWLAALGSLRRNMRVLDGQVSEDLLLLVAPATLVALAILATRRGAFRDPTPLTYAVLALAVLIVFGAVNPLQGSVAAGVAGLLFTFVPTLAFWIGRTLDDDGMKRVLWLLGALAIGAATYGFFQTFNGFPSWDQTWIEESGYDALNVGDTIRPFGSFTAASEYTWYLAMGAVVWASLGLRRAPALAIPALALLLTAVFFASQRGALVLLAAALALMFAARARLSLGAGIAVVVVSIVAIPLVVSAVAGPSAVKGHEANLVEHQVEGLSNPFDPETSTVGQHWEQVSFGFESALVEPLGRGISAVNVAGEKFREGSDDIYNTEQDPSNVAVALGLPGLLVYVVLFVLALGGAFKLARSDHDGLALAALGILIVTLFQWLTGGQYAVALVPWLVLGWIDAQMASRRAAAAAQPA